MSDAAGRTVVRLEAKAGKEAALEKFLRGGLAIVNIYLWPTPSRCCLSREIEPRERHLRVRNFLQRGVLPQLLLQKNEQGDTRSVTHMIVSS